MIRTRLALPALLLAAALVGCGGGSDPAAAPSTSAAPSTTSAAPRNEVECVNVNRAYNAWDSPSRPKTAADFAGINLVTLKMVMEAGDDFAKAVTGYEAQASKTLAVAVAEYNVEVAMANAEMTITDETSTEQAEKLEKAAAKVESDYRAWKTATC